MNKIKLTFNLFSLGTMLVLCNSARADVTLPSIFSDHMVLQENVAVPIWGWADPGEKISVSIAGQTQTTTADATGKWKLKLDKQKAIRGSIKIIRQIFLTA